MGLVAVAHFDVLIIGAGISGIGAAFHLQRDCPTKSYAILEGRNALGGTWDLFRYPGIRSDSDMYTLGYSFKPEVSSTSVLGCIIQFDMMTNRAVASLAGLLGAPAAQSKAPFGVSIYSWASRGNQ